MLIIRKAVCSDRYSVSEVLGELDLEYPSLNHEHFWVAELDHRVIAVAGLEEFPDFFFLSALGTTASQQGKGIAKRLLKEIIRSCHKDIFLYTIIPDFFEKFGFGITDPRIGLPDRGTLGCENCKPDKCVCMVFISSPIVQKPKTKDSIS